ncbi:hypothetical protein ACYSNO_00805 [Enterococcus sp. LJL98]
MEAMNQMTFKELKEMVAKLEEQKVADETKVFLDTGWDSIQEMLSGSLLVEEAQVFEIEDELNGEVFQGYCLLEKSEKMQASGPAEKVIVLKNLY